MENNKIVFAFQYCPCTQESALATKSLHYSEEGAIKAMEIHKAKEMKEFKDLYEDDPHAIFGEFEKWCVEKITIFP